MAVCSCICFLFDFLASVLLSDCTNDGIQAAEVAVNKMITLKCTQLQKKVSCQYETSYTAPIMTRNLLYSISAV